MPVLPSAESAAPHPKSPAPLSPLPVSFAPSCDHVAGLANLNDQPAPAPPSAGPPTSAEVASAERATLDPNCPAPVSSFGVSFEPTCDQAALLVNTHAAPALPLSSGAPIKAVN